MIKKEEAKIGTILTSLWERNLPLLFERLDTLDRVATEATSGELAEAKRQEGLDIAHKLSGALGMFGYRQGTEIARQMEQILSSPTPATLRSLASLAANLRQTLMNK